MYLKAKGLSMLAAEDGTERNVKIRYLKKKINFKGNVKTL